MEVVLFVKDERRLNKLKQRDSSRRVLRAYVIALLRGTFHPIKVLLNRGRTREARAVRYRCSPEKGRLAAETESLTVQSAG